MDELRLTIEAVFRRESGRIIAGLIRIARSFDLAEEARQDAFIAAEIARAFLIPEATLAQRLVRAKRKIQQAKIPYQTPSAEALPERVSAVQVVLYLNFNEGYLASSGDSLIRQGLARKRYGCPGRAA